MRNSWFKYLFILFAIGIVIFAVVKIKGDEENKKQEQLAKENKQEERIKEITLGVAEFDSINPIISRNLNVQNISKLIFEPLINLSNTFKPEPALATEWAKQDATTYLIKLRENVKWSDGTDFTAEDVRFTIDRLKVDTPSIYGNNVQFIERVDVVDKSTLKITLAKEIPFFEYFLTFPIMSSKYFTVADFSSAEKNAKPIGTGKYKILEVQPNVITLEKNENWWNSKKIGLSLEKIYINLYSSAGELYNSFKTGNIDLLATNNNSFSDYIGTIGYNLKEVRSREHVFLALNTQSEYLQDVNVRKALAGFIDKSNITTNVYGAKYYTTSFPLEYGSYLYKGLTPGIDFNIENAQNVLNEAGWELKYESWQKYEDYRTKRIKLNFVVKASNEAMVAIAENITDQLQAQGLKINLIRASDETYQAYKDSKEYDIILCDMQLPLSPDLTTFFGEANLANYTNDEISQIMNEVKNTTDEKALHEKYERLEQIYNTEVPYISIANSKYNVLYNSNLVGDVAPNWFYVLYNIEGWYKN